MTYLYLKAVHLIGVVSWFAGLFYIFRLFVYHTENRDNQAISSLLCVMERRLYYAIMWPAMVLTLIMGASMIAMNPELLNAHWMRAKLFFVLILIAYHLFSGHVRKQFATRNFFLTSRQCRVINEVPTLILIVVMLLVILRPF
jgi:putative membrane protein